MSDTPRTDAVYVPSPQYAQIIRFEGTPYAAIDPDGYEQLHTLCGTLEKELAATVATYKSYAMAADIQATELTRLRTELAACRRNEARYLWCRQRMDTFCVAELATSVGEIEPETDAEVDTAIDTAIAAEGEK